MFYDHGMLTYLILQINWYINFENVQPWPSVSGGWTLTIELRVQTPLLFRNLDNFIDPLFGGDTKKAIGPIYLVGK